mmetsp:Transcript_12128/g.20123  ORF Transcript_12128/g.20123 Transcript_12128/m.20123 type:complete len:220 (-) Transcript_12128:42-701(-)
MAPDATVKNDRSPKDQSEIGSSTESTPPGSRVNSIHSLNDLDVSENSSSSAMSKQYASRKTLAGRSKIPYSMYSIAALVIGAQWSGGIYSFEVMESVGNSLRTAAHSTWSSLEYLRDLTHAVCTGQSKDPIEIITAAFATLCFGCCFFVLFIVPIRAGMWTGTRARRHKIHRYLGLIFLIQYFAAWVEYICNYDEGGKDSYLSHFVGMNGALRYCTCLT